jgi:hypothetical protein
VIDGARARMSLALRRKRRSDARDASRSSPSLRRTAANTRGAEKKKSRFRHWETTCAISAAWDAFEVLTTADRTTSRAGERTETPVRSRMTALPPNPGGIRPHYSISGIVGS